MRTNNNKTFPAFNVDWTCVFQIGNHFSNHMHEQNGFLRVKKAGKKALHKIVRICSFLWNQHLRNSVSSTKVFTKTMNLTCEEYLCYLFPSKLLTFPPFSLFHFFSFNHHPFFSRLFFLIKKSLLSKIWKASMRVNNSFPLPHHPFFFHPEGQKAIQKEKFVAILSNARKSNTHASCIQNNNIVHPLPQLALKDFISFPTSSAWFQIQ